ncbi:hypothetical protein [Methylobacter sp.]|uniref:hypothetical protein n=1 Tax=Methylobacter sp. TaxID=2051955 RepID=UPI002489F349|nr:hypothetical protein [Methylobacter sp.]MDI1278071.1 hypothetical protein [Methylobacter sp.]
MSKQDQNPGHHDGFNGEPGTYLLLGGARVAVDPATHEPLPVKAEPEQQSEAAPEPTPVPEKTKPAAKPADKAEAAANPNKSE